MPYDFSPLTKSHDPAFRRDKSAEDIVMDPQHFRELLRRIKKHPDNAGNARRDYMMFVIMGNLGLRIGEVPLLKREHFKRLKSSPPLAVVPAKKKKDPSAMKSIYVHPKVAAEIMKCLDTDMARNQVLLFPGASGEGHICDRQISRVFQSYARKCSFDQDYSPHSVRHMYGAQIYRKTKDLVFHADQLGHETVPGVAPASRRYMHFSKPEINAYLKRIGYFL